MLISLGQRTQSPDDIVDALLECHQRIRRFTEMTVLLGRRNELAATETTSQIERYFRMALPLHVRDEEETVIPRLQGRSPDLDRALAAMKAEHEDHAPPIAQLFAALERREPAGLLEAGAALTAAFTPHLEQEERLIFPALRQWVSTDDRRAMLGELRARRG